MLILNRIRGMFSWFAWVVGALLGGLVYVKFGSTSAALWVMAGYIAGESMGWGEWIGGIIHPDQTPDEYDIEGDNNGIYWLASKMAARGTPLYNHTALRLRGYLWWSLTLLPLAFIIGITPVLLAIIVLGIAFPLSVVVAKKCTFNIKWLNTSTTWNRAEVIYGAMTGVVLFCLFFGTTI